MGVPVAFLPAAAPLAMAVTRFAVVLRIPQRFDAAARHDDRPAIAAGSHQPVDPAFETEPVGDDETRIRKLPRMVGTGLEDVDIRARRDQAGDAHRIAAHLLDDVGKQVEGRDHGKPAIVQRSRRSL